MDASYFLNRYVYFCPIAEGGVFMDLRRNKYSAATLEEVSVLGLIVQDLPMQVSEPVPHAVIDRLLNKLLKAGLITLDASQGRLPVPVLLPAAVDAPIDEERPRPRIEWHHVFCFVWACAFVKVLLIFQPLDRIVERMRLEKQRHSYAFDSDKEQALTNIFFRMRPAIYQASSKCFYDSLVHFKFLTCYRIHPSFVIGVANQRPFSAHSWLQQETRALNSSAEMVKKFSPILVV